jgi:hypothetical protein
VEFGIYTKITSLCGLNLRLWAGAFALFLAPKEKQPKKHDPLSTPNIYKEEDVEEYSSQLLQLMDSLGPCGEDCDASDVLEKICRQSVNIARKVRPLLRKTSITMMGGAPYSSSCGRNWSA